MNEKQNVIVPIRKWGNSQGIRIPKKFIENLHIKENESLEMSIVEDSIIIKKCKKFNNLQERLESFYGKPIEEIFVESTEDISWGEPTGKEIW